MLPSSHPDPINALSARNQPLKLGRRQIGGNPVDRIGYPDQPLDETQASSAVLLATEFSEFISAASRLEASYRKLQEEVAELGTELAERNEALNLSLAENEHTRLALQQIVDSMPCGVLVANSAGEIVIINPESRRLLELARATFQQNASLSFQQIRTVSGIDIDALFQAAGDGDTTQELCIRDPGGNRWIEVRNRRLSHEAFEAHEVEQMILILREITAQKRAEVEREAGRNAVALAEITSILAHEIRNPLGSLELFAELIEEDEDHRSRWISNLRAGIRTLSGTVNNVLSFHGSGSLKLIPLQLSSLIGNAMQFARPLAEQASVSLEWGIAHDEISVMGNEAALQQVVLNVVFNAIRHTPAGGSVVASLRTRREPGRCGEGVCTKQVVVEIVDTGVGIRADQIDRVFDPGFSGSGDTSGLGLSVCDRIMKQHGGKISASSQFNSGAQFNLYLPVIEQDRTTL
jgi:two-component system sensor histidine kinase FlrB